MQQIKLYTSSTCSVIMFMENFYVYGKILIQVIKVINIQKTTNTLLNKVSSPLVLLLAYALRATADQPSNGFIARVSSPLVLLLAYALRATAAQPSNGFIASRVQLRQASSENKSRQRGTTFIFHHKNTNQCLFHSISGATAMLYTPEMVKQGPLLS